MAEPGTETGRRFTAGYDPKSGEFLVYGAFFVAALSALIAFLREASAALILTAVCVAAALYYRPLIDVDRPQIIADDGGLTLEGLGTIAWTDIERMSVRRTAVRQIETVYLDLALKRPVRAAAIDKDPRPRWRQWTTKNWRKTGDRAIRVTLHSLSEPPNKVLAAIGTLSEMPISDNQQA